jgi:hypothetical protein
MRGHIDKNVKFIAQKTGHRYPGTPCPQGEVTISPTPGTKVRWDTPRWGNGVRGFLM